MLFSGDKSIGQTSIPSSNITPLPTVELSSYPTPLFTKAPSLFPTVTLPSPQIYLDISPNYDTSTIITFDDFEDNWGSYESGGNDALIVIFHARGGHAAKIRDGSVAINASFFHHSNHDVTQFNILSVHLWFKALNLKGNKYFVLEYSSDGGNV